MVCFYFIINYFGLAYEISVDIYEEELRKVATLKSEGSVFIVIYFIWLSFLFQCNLKALKYCGDNNCDQ